MFREKLKSFSNYTTPVQEVTIKSDANENLLDFPKPLFDIISDIMLGSINHLNLYPEMNSEPLKEEIARFYRIRKENIIVGNGSDQLIQIIIQAACEKGDFIFTLYPSFVMYKITAELLDVNHNYYDISDNWSFDVLKVIEHIKSDDKIKLIFIDSPNNPTGVAFKIEDLELLIKKCPDRLFVIDNAYGEYCDIDYLDLAIKYKNVIILKTFSKIGFAGIRCGYAIASKEIIDILHRVKPPYNVNCVTQRIAIEVLKNFELLKPNIELIKHERNRMIKLIEKSYFVLPTFANFISIVDDEGDKIFEFLKNNDILIKRFNINGKKLLRITINKPSANDIIVENLLRFKKG